MCKTSKMHHRIHAIQARHPVIDRIDIPVIRDLSTLRELWVFTLRTSRISYGCYDIVPGFRKLMAQVPPNETGRPGYQHAHFISASLS
jgi:hypothetical protein